LKNVLVFFDPDTGIQAGRKKRIKINQCEKYVLNEELGRLLKIIHNDSIFVIYQHLQRNSDNRQGDLKRKYDVIKEIDPQVFINIYGEKDLAFIFITKNNELDASVKKALENYFKGSNIKSKFLI